jgi:plastocyanin
MRTSITRILPILLLFGATSSWATSHTVIVGGASSDPYGSGQAVLMFNPSNLTINAGDTVTFTNAGGFHNVAANDGSFRCANGCANDGHGGTGDPSDDLWSSTITFNQAGTINYHCDVHVSMGMTGSITVQGTAPTTVPITAGFSGAWYDPAQSGHGLLLQVLSGAPSASDQLVAYWYTFNPEGTQQAWFGGIGPINADTAVVTTFQTTGGRWIPNFDPATIVNNPWGTLTFTFSDCGHGRVDFSSTVAGFGNGHMDLIRLTQLAGLSCP